MKTREEQIAEMAKDLEQAKYLAMGTAGSLNNGFGGWYGAYMYDAGYRKQSDTVKECLQVLRDTGIPCIYDEYSWGWDNGIDTAIKRIAERYNVDEEETK